MSETDNWGQRISAPEQPAARRQPTVIDISQFRLLSETSPCTHQRTASALSPPTSPQRRSSTHHTPRQPPRHKRESQKQDQPRLPSHPRPTVRIGICAQPCLLDRVDDQHAESRAYPGDPVHELDVDEASISEGGAVGGGVDEEEESEGELL